MACFDNIISYRSNCRGVVSTSGLYLEDIGITPKECGNYINSEYKNGEELIEDKVRFAIETIKSTLANDLSSYFNIKSILENKTLGFYQDSNVVQGSVNTLGGFRFKINDSQPYLTAYVSSVSLLVNVSQIINVLVYDLITGLLLDTIPVQTIANKVSTTYVNKNYSSTNKRVDLAFVYNTTGINSNNTLLSDTGCAHCNGYKFTNYYIDTTPITINDSLSKNISSIIGTSNTSGLSINYSLQCSVENWICELSNRMALPILYKTGQLIMEYAVMYSDRINSDSTIDIERNEKRLDQYSSAYSQALKAVISKVKPANNACFSCRDAITTKIILP